MSVTERPIVIRSPGTKPASMRTDGWWVYPVVTVVILSFFVLYGSWVAFANTDYFVDPYLSPFYSPCLAARCDETTFNLVGDWWKLSPALLILPFPFGAVKQSVQDYATQRMGPDHPDPYSTNAIGLS